MGVGNWLPSMEHRLFYVDLDSWLDEKEFSKLVQSGEVDADVSYEAYLQESYDSELEMVVGALEAAAKIFQQHGLSFESFRYGDRASMNLQERTEWMHPLLECGWVRVAVKEVEISKLVVVTYPVQQIDQDCDLANLSRAEFVSGYGLTPERLVTSSSMQLDALDELLISVIEEEINAVGAKTVTRRSCAWTSRLVLESKPLGGAVSKFRKAYRHGLPRKQLRHAA